MIMLKDLRRYFEEMAARVDGLKKVVGISVEANMADRINAVDEDDSPTLFYLPPSGDGSGQVDRFVDKSMIVVFVMKKYNPRKTTSMEVLEEVQPVVEALKEKLVADSGAACCPLDIDLSTISTLPETEFFGNWAGWSVGFTCNDW